MPAFRTADDTAFTAVRMAFRSWVKSPVASGCFRCCWSTYRVRVMQSVSMGLLPCSAILLASTCAAVVSSLVLYLCQMLSCRAKRHTLVGWFTVHARKTWWPRKVRLNQGDITHDWKAADEKPLTKLLSLAGWDTPPGVWPWPWWSKQCVYFSSNRPSLPCGVASGRSSLLAHVTTVARWLCWSDFFVNQQPKTKSQSTEGYWF